ncbi:hypothetical protein PM076_04105 [Halorubrum ezzemoulense]|uniref:DUF7979 domain-containing protein n=1 Tax=Halorubrum ezzemoulense TaxID=337243 RepID=A0ABT4Z105_HALEZ|nr:hypothetical protein [Halorubrum ezzemoulense]MDB2244385.1 hypothetical protein [Halorubrum ezzemoulense]MDB2278858.1 hypothetical protein [Halorubrum ezzemoulense]MDB2287719.1 hypothetical protein [Halorubrum ezzemoulense]MDB2291844.1 hypothetical protein [Halorubrum ezzemoulense]MDB2295493.1 hypothetical protein [Halorubrum ezzemoulense]
MSLRDTGRRLRLRRTGRVPADARVRHYDELDDDEQEIVRELADEPQTAPETGDLDDGDVVKFTDYYQVRAR